MPGVGPSTTTPGRRLVRYALLVSVSNTMHFRAASQNIKRRVVAAVVDCNKRNKFCTDSFALCHTELAIVYCGFCPGKHASMWHALNARAVSRSEKMQSPNELVCLLL